MKENVEYLKRYILIASYNQEFSFAPQLNGCGLRLNPTTADKKSCFAQARMSPDSRLPGVIRGTQIQHE